MSRNPLVIGSHLYRWWNESSAGCCVTKKGITSDWVFSAYTDTNQPSRSQFEFNFLYTLTQSKSSQAVGLIKGRKTGFAVLAAPMDVRSSSDSGISDSGKVWVQLQPAEEPDHKRASPGPHVWRQGVLAWDLARYLQRPKVQAEPKLHKKGKVPYVRNTVQKWAPVEGEASRKEGWYG